MCGTRVVVDPRYSSLVLVDDRVDGVKIHHVFIRTLRANLKKKSIKFQQENQGRKHQLMTAMILTNITTHPSLDLMNVPIIL